MSRKLKQVISCQSFSPISDVRDGIIVTKDGKFVKLMEFSPINYGLRSNEDMGFCAKNGRYRTMKQWSRMSNT